MSDSEDDSRTAAVGRKRNAAGELKSLTDSRRPSASSKESGEVSSSSDSDNDDNASSEDSDSDIEEISADQWSKRQKTSAASEEGQVSSSDRSMDTDSSSDDSSVIEVPRPSKHQDSSPTTRIADLAPRDREAQQKYFNITSTTAPVRCLSCGERGHMAATCSARTCSHCHQRDLHASSACPTYRKCGLCRERGHDARMCRNRAFRGSDPCDVCAQSSHIEEECPYLWRVSVRAVSRQGGGGEGVSGGRRAPDALNYDDDDDGTKSASSSPPPPPPPEREQRRPWQLMGLFEDARD